MIPMIFALVTITYVAFSYFFSRKLTAGYKLEIEKSNVWVNEKMVFERNFKVFISIYVVTVFILFMGISFYTRQ